jgi:hypothetical protein
MQTNVYELVLNWPTCTLLVLYSYSTTGAALPSVSTINAGIWHVENAAPCTVARDVTEVTWSLPTVAWPNSYHVTQQHTEKRDGKRREARHGSALLLLRNRVPWGFWILEEKGGKARQRSATVAQSRSLRFLNFISSHMGRLRHNIHVY